MKLFKINYNKLYRSCSILGVRSCSIIYKNNFKEILDFLKFINDMNIQNVTDFKKNHPGVYDIASNNKFIKYLNFPNPLVTKRNLYNKTIDDIKKYLKDNNITTISEFKEFDYSMYDISYRRHIMNDLGLIKNSKSSMEKFVPKYLLKENIIFEEQKTFDWLIYSQNLRYDIYIESKKIAIELQGSLHFYYDNNCKFFKNINDYNLMKQRDLTKYSLSKEHGIEVIYYVSITTKYYSKIPKDVFNGNYLGKVFNNINNLINYIKLK